MSQTGDSDPRQVAAERRAETADDDPITEDTRNLIGDRGVPVCYLGVISRDVVGFTPDDEVAVQVYRNHIEIHPKTDGE